MNMDSVELACLLTENNKLKAEIAKIQARNERKYKLIETIAVSEDDITIISRTQEPDGTPYNYEKILVKAAVKQGTYSGQVRCRINGEIVSAATWVKPDTACWGYGKLSIENGIITPYFTSGTSTQSAGLAQYSTYNFMGCMFLDSMTSFQIEVINLDGSGLSAIPVGSTFEIYAVRSD